MTGERLSTKSLLSLIIVQMVISGILYLWQETLVYDVYIYNSLRLMRFLVVYVGLSVVFNSLDGKAIVDIGIRVEKHNILINLITGISIYGIAGLVFIKNSIFEQGWGLLGKNELIFALLTAGLMAAITDFWTRGFILFQLKDRYNSGIAILGQNLVWFIVHIYEILLISEYISILGAVLLTLFLGITGDLIAIRTKSVIGLMLGHIVLNLMIVGSAQGFF